MTQLTLDQVRERIQSRTPARISDPMAAQAAVSLILVPSGGDLEALFIRRAEMAGDPWSGQMALPGGRRDPGDADLLATATRETREEVGILLPPESLIGELDDFTPRTRALPQIVVRPYVFGLLKRPELQASPEVAYRVWLRLGELSSAHRTVTVEAQGSQMEVPAFVVGPDVVWGLTERIVSPFIDLLP